MRHLALAGAGCGSPPFQTAVFVRCLGRAVLSVLPSHLCLGTLGVISSICNCVGDEMCCKYSSASSVRDGPH